MRRILLPPVIPAHIDRAYIMMAEIGIDLGCMKIEVAALDMERRILDRRSIATPEGGYDAILTAIVALVHDCENTYRRARWRLIRSIGEAPWHVNGEDEYRNEEHISSLGDII